MTMNTQQRFERFEHNFAAFVGGDLTRSEDVINTCQDFYRHMTSSLENLMISIPVLSDEDLEQRIDDLEANEKMINKAYKPLRKRAENKLVKAASYSPHRRGEVESVLNHFLSHSYSIVEIMRDTRMALVCVLSERQKDHPPVATFREGDNFDEVFDSL
ncbi:hypothetical protein [Endozoicomonas montiporae]|nr:hypothetical protein [Endozoicomonas montiporae]